MKLIRFLIYISVILFFITDAYSGMNLSKNANLLLNGHLTGDNLTTVGHCFLKANISIMTSVYFAWFSAFLIALYGMLNCFNTSNKQ